MKCSMTQYTIVLLIYSSEKKKTKLGIKLTRFIQVQRGKTLLLLLLRFPIFIALYMVVVIVVYDRL